MLVKGYQVLMNTMDGRFGNGERHEIADELSTVSLTIGDNYKP